MIPGVVQFKVGDDIFTLDYCDTKIDYGATNFRTYEANKSSNAELAAAINEAEAATEQVVQDIQKIASPYRFFAGDDAIIFLQQIVNQKAETGKDPKYRSIGIDRVLSRQGQVPIDTGFINLLTLCNIEIDRAGL